MPADEASVNPPGAGGEALTHTYCTLHPYQENVYYSMDEPLGWTCNVCGNQAHVTAIPIGRVRSRPDSGTENEEHEDEDHEPCPTCGGRGWHTAGGNDPMACGTCPAGERWSQGEDHEAGLRAVSELPDDEERAAMAAEERVVATWPQESAVREQHLRVVARTAAVAAMTYLSRVSPSPERDARDGTAAVEDVVAWLRAKGKVSLDSRFFFDCNWLADEIGNGALAEFASPASAGDRAPDEDPAA